MRRLKFNCVLPDSISVTLFLFLFLFLFQQSAYAQGEEDWDQFDSAADAVSEEEPVAVSYTHLTLPTIA